MLRRSLIIGLLLCAAAISPTARKYTLQQEISRLATLFQWRPGSVVADVGAGPGKLTLAAAQRVGPSGKVYSTEINKTSLARLQNMAAKKTISR